MRRTLTLICNLAACILCFAANSATPVQPATAPYQIENSYVVAIQSQLLKREYELYIKLPNSYATEPKRRYPILFLHDARYAFPLVSSLTRQLANAGKIEELIIVGISYSKGDNGDVSRTRDYTPTHSPNEKIGHSTAARQASGQASAYLRFIMAEVFPFVARNYRADMSRKSYAGHSFGALFGAYVLLTAPTTFENYIVSDPSLWYDNEVTLSLSPQRKSDSKRAINVLLVSSSPPPAPVTNDGEPEFPFKMVQNARRLEALLKKNYASDTHITLEVIDGEIHETLFPIAMSHALLRFYAK